MNASSADLPANLKAFMTPDETAFDLFVRQRRPNPKTGLHRLDRFINNGNGFPIGESISITGHHGSGKTSLLHAIVAEAVLPRSFGGSEQCVVLFDNDWAGALEKLERTIKQKLASRSKPAQVKSSPDAALGDKSQIQASPHLNPRSGTERFQQVDNSEDTGYTSDDDLDDDNLLADADFDLDLLDDDESVIPSEDTAVRDCLSRVVVLRCRSSFEFLVSLSTLFRIPAIQSSEGIAMIVIDSLASFHLHDVGCPRAEVERTHKQINSLLRGYATRHRIPIIASKPVSLMADGSRVFEPTLWAGLRNWNIRLTRAGDTRKMDHHKTFVKVEVRHFASELNKERRTGTVMLQIDDTGIH